MPEEKFNKDGSPRKRKKDGSYKKSSWDDPEVRAQRTKSLKEHWADPEKKAKHIEAFNTNSCKEKQRESAIHKWKDPDYRAKNEETARNLMKAMRNDPEISEKWLASTRKELEERYADPVRSAEIANNISKGQTKSWADPETHKQRTASLCRGPEHHWYIDGTGISAYGPGFNNSLKRKVRKRDEYTCALCGVHWKQGQRAFHVHHINADKFDNRMQNLITLCPSCHAKADDPPKRSSFQHILSDMMLVDEHFSEKFTLIA